MYIYESHMGGLFVSDDELDYEGGSFLCLKEVWNGTEDCSRRL